MQSLNVFRRNLLATSKRSSSLLFATQQAALFSTFNYEVKARVQHPAPHFEGMSWNVDGFKKISLKDYAGKYVVLFTYPLDFTFVCPTEIIEFSDLADKFRENSKNSVAN
jgi:peroxiredoxin